MKIQLASGEVFDLGATETNPTIGITDYSRRVTDDYGITTVVERGFARRMSVRLGVPFASVDAIQRKLASLRATAATWVADDRLASLKVNGFFKDFEIDLSVPPLSYCTLTVEGLLEADAVADAGSDPAPAGQSSTLNLLQPAPVSESSLVASTIVENDYPAWSSSRTYALGERVLKSPAHRIYESSAAGNIGNDPAGETGKWTDIGPTNRWAMFDQALGSTSSATSSISVTVDAPVLTAVALLDVVAATVRVQAIGYDRTVAASEGAITFLDLPVGLTRVVVTIAGSGIVSVGTLLVGKLVNLGITESSPTAGITDFSRKDVDDFGEVTIVERAWAKRMVAKALIRTDAVDAVAGRITAVRALPALWIGQTGIDSLMIYGFFKDYSIEIGETVSKLSLSIEGLSTAGKIEPFKAGAVDWPAVGDPIGTKPANNATNSADPKSPFGSGTVGSTIAQLGGFDTQIAAARTDLAYISGTTIPAINKAVADAGTRIDQAQQAANDGIAAANQKITDINGSIGDVNGRITAAMQNADNALAAAVARLDNSDAFINRRIDSVAASGGYDDSNVYAEVRRVDETAINRDGALGRRVDGIVTDYQAADASAKARIDQVATTASDAKTAVADLNTSLNTRFTGINDTLSRYDGRITTLSSDVQGYANRTSVLETTVGPADPSKPALTARIATAESVLTDLPNQFATAARATALEVSAGNPIDFTMRGLYYGQNAWQGQNAQLPDSLFTGDSLGGFHYVNATSGGSYSVGPRRPLPFAGKIYRYQAMIRAVGNDGTYSADYEWSGRQTGADGGSYAGFTPLPVSAGWVTIDYVIDGTARTEAWLNPHLRGSIGIGGKIKIAYFRCLDITTTQAIGAVNARVNTTEQASQDRDTALGKRIDSVAASGGYNDTNIYAEVRRVDQAAIDRDAAIGQSIVSVTSSYQNADTATNGRIDQVATTASNAAQSVSDLSTSVNTRFSNVNTTLSGYDGRITTLSSDVQGYANRTGTLETTVGPADGSEPPLTSRVTSTENAIANFPQNYAAATRASDLEAKVNGTAPSNLLARANDQASVIADAKVGVVAQSLSSLSASLTPALANLGSSFPSWPDGQAAPTYWTVWAGTNVRVSPGLVGAFSVRNDVTRGAGAGLTTSFALDPGMAPLKGDAAYLLRGDLTLLGGGLRGAGILVQGFDANGVQVAEVKFAFNTFETSPGNIVGNGQMGKRYVFKRAVTIPPVVAKLQLFMISDWYGFDGDSVTKSLLWHECGIRLGTDVDTVSAQITTQAGALAGPGGASVAWSVTGTTADGNTMIQLSKRDGSAGLFYINANVLIDGNLLVNGTVTTRVVAPNAITQWASISGSSGEVDAGAAPAYSDPLTIVTQGGLVKLDCSFDASNGSGTGPFFFVTLQRDGGDVTRQFAVRTTGTSVPNFFTISDTPPAGSHSYRMYFGRSAAGSSVMQFSNTAIFAQEFKR
ncbi:hypothetical protein [Sphingomonas sp. TREG-RG-20F-R18-01]|uniref:hypothetical protein n=1 Tax=Sphingomonas sp. TREG-RG-20F-R18-01 TaxID=2914982 RepID=UPI001F5815F0|nr:hypothetical protein [Sphingomonas sp. TREG-RG-20F-R18-01]